MSKLALLGGTPEIRRPRLTRWPKIEAADKRAVQKVLDRGILCGPYAPAVKALEKAFAAFCGVQHCLATNSGTSALHIAVAAAGIGPGDEVLCPSFTFLATALAVLQHNAIPVFVDMDPVTFNIDTRKIEEKITPRTKAIIPVHIHGLPADMDEINAIAKRHGLIVIEDAAQAHGALYKGKKTGSLGAMGCFSVQGSKNLPAGEGGLFVTNDKKLRDTANMVRMFGEDIHDDSGVVMDKTHPLEDAREYNAYIMGWMYRITEMTAAMALSQLSRLNKTTRNAQANGNYLSAQLSQYPGVQAPKADKQRTHVFHKYRLRVNAGAMGLGNVPPRKLRDTFIKALAAEGVEVALWQTRPLPGQDLFRNKTGYGKGCPWSHGDGNITYRAEDYPETQKLLDDSFLIGSESYPVCAQSLATMKQYMKAFDKVYHGISKALKA